jgi:hypothetical protein
MLMAVNAPAADLPTIVSRIPRHPVQSSALVSVGYSKRLHVLEVEFTNGAVYRYIEVPRSFYRGLMSADSKARFYHANIKRKFRSVRVRLRTKEKSGN